jgi:hypothetical protein
MEVIRTERLVLRDFEEADWKLVHDYASDPEVVRYMEWGPNAIENTRDFIKKAITHFQEHPRMSYDFAVVLTSQKCVNWQLRNSRVKIRWTRRMDWLCLQSQFLGTRVMQLRQRKRYWLLDLAN